MFKVNEKHNIFNRFGRNTSIQTVAVKDTYFIEYRKGDEIKYFPIELATVVKALNIDLHDSDTVSNYEDGPKFDIKKLNLYTGDMDQIGENQMNIETIVNQFETRAGTLLRYYTGLLEHSKVQPYCFKLYNDPFDMVYVVTNSKLFGHVYIKDCKVRQSFELASPKHTEGLIRSIEGHYVGYELHDGKQLSISDMMASQLFEDEYFMYGLQTYAESNNSDVFEYLENGFDTDTLEGIQSSNTDVIANIEMLYQLATGINEPVPELVEGLKLVTEFVQDENATQEDYKALERKLNDLKASYYSLSK